MRREQSIEFDDRPPADQRDRAAGSRPPKRPPIRAPHRRDSAVRLDDD
jgi:hypothetical protein